MEYYYDVYLNYQSEYYMFYEWDKNDPIEFIRKIPIFHIESSIFNKMLTTEFKVTETFLKIIENKTKEKQNKVLKYNAIVCDGKNSLALEFMDDGKILNKSSLLLEDELNINEFIYNIPKLKIEIEVLKDNNIRKETRQDIKIKKILKLEIDNMYTNKNISKLKYIYLEWFNELIDDIDLMYKRMLGKIEGKLTKDEYKIYEIIKVSYNNV